MGVELYATVSGSFRKHYAAIATAVDTFRAAGVHILSPRAAQPVSESGDFVYLEGDLGSPSDVEIGHLNAILESDFLYVVNPNGYSGVSSAFEMGFARSTNVPIFCKARPRDSMLEGLVRYGMSPSKIASTMAAKKRRGPSLKLDAEAGLPHLQRYVAEMVKRKGFAEESPRDVTLLLMEEVGELARVIRERSGLKTGHRSKRTASSLAAELADAFIYILDLANKTGVDLETAVGDKLAANARRRWR